MSMNLAKALRAVIPTASIQIGTVMSTDAGSAVVQLPGGALISVRGDAAVGAKVYVRSGLIESSAPDLPVELITL